RTPRRDLLLSPWSRGRLRLPQAEAGTVPRDPLPLQGRPGRGARDRRPAPRPAGRARGRLPTGSRALRKGRDDDDERRPAARHGGTRRPGRGGRRTGALMRGDRTASRALRSALFVLFQLVTVAPYA